MKKKDFSILKHYKKLWFFNFNRLKDNNYASMREYFAEIFIMEIEEFMPLGGKKVLDVGGARGEFCRVLSEMRGCRAVNLEPSPYEYGKYESDFLWPDTVTGTADSMPFGDSEFDLVMCRGVFEHIYPELQQKSLDEMYRVTKPGGMCYITIPPWFNPWAGHGLKPFHYFPFRTAKFLAEKAYGKKIKESSWRERRLFPVTFRAMRAMIKKSGFEIAATKDTHFRMDVLTRIPVIREIAVPAVAFMLQKV
jgi:ubiquinone/menaquinone biosynthesis C-methylase UbiE